jgi:hypothetical protein
MMIERNVGIVGDGATDLEIFKKLVDCILSGSHTNYVELERQTLRDHIDKYWSAASSSNAYYLPAKHALTLQNEVTNVLDGAFWEFEGRVGIGSLSNSDIFFIVPTRQRHGHIRDAGASELGSHASAWEPENSVLSTVQNKFWTHKSKFLDGLAERNLYIYKSPSSADFEIRGKILVYNKNNTLPASMNLTY